MTRAGDLLISSHSTDCSHLEHDSNVISEIFEDFIRCKCEEHRMLMKDFDTIKAAYILDNVGCNLWQMLLCKSSMQILSNIRFM